jgi:EmrB/QacA subfamily drug resistance transporter
MPAAPSFLSTRRGKLTLALLCAIAFLDIVDAAIVNVALPSIRHDLRFSVRSLQWVLGGYMLTYGGFMLLGGRAADLLGRRRVLVAGTVLFGVASLVGGLAASPGVLVGARLAQGLGAAMMTPAALSTLTTTFAEPRERAAALGAWAAVGGLAAAAGVLLGGVLTAGPGWRWVLFVNPPVCAIVLVEIFHLLDGERRRAPFADFDALGAVLATAGMLLLVFALVDAPHTGWGSERTILELAGAAVLLIAFAVTEEVSRNPLVPPSIFRIKGLAAANVTQLIAFAGLLSMFFFLTLYMQNVLGYSPIRTGLAYLPFCVCAGVGSAVGSQVVARVGTRPVIVTGALISAATLYRLSDLPVHGSYVSDLLPAMVLAAIGLSSVFVGVTTAANAGVPADKAGLAAALVNASQQLGGALGLSILSALTTSRTYHAAFLAASLFLLAAAVIALRITQTRGDASETSKTPPFPDGILASSTERS